jgi:hypothetical protein
MSNVGRKHGPSAEDVIAMCQDTLGPERTRIRQAEIDALPWVMWNGRKLYGVRCQGTSGKGPHWVNLPLAMVWSLITLDHFYCPFHAGDAWAEEAR